MLTQQICRVIFCSLAFVAVFSTVAQAQYPYTEGNDNGAYAWEMQSGSDFDWDYGPGNTGITPHILPNNMAIGPIPIGFNFSFHGSVYTEFWLSAHGFLSFIPLAINQAGPLNGEMYPAPSLSGPIIAPCFSGLAPGYGGTVTSRYFGVAPHRRYVLEFDEVPYMGQQGTANFQVALYEHDGSFDLRHDGTNLPTQYSSGLPGYNLSIGFQKSLVSGLTMVGPTHAGSTLQPPLIATSWLGYKCPLPGSGESLSLIYKTIDVFGFQTPSIHCGGPRLHPGETMTTELVSKGGFHEFQELILVFQTYFIGGVTPWSPVGFPTVHLTPYMAPSIGFAHVGMAVTGQRVINNFVIPAGIAGAAARFQAYVFGTNNANGFFASSHALDLIALP